MIYYDGKIFPIQSETIDLVFHTEVAEHIPDLHAFFTECHRVLKKDGIMVFSIPFSARYHYIPYDFRRLTPAGINLYLSRAGFQSVQVFPRSTDITVACYKLVTVGYRWLLSKRIWNALLAVIFSPMFLAALLIGQCALWLEIGEYEDCLGYVVKAKKTSQFPNRAGAIENAEGKS